MTTINPKIRRLPGFRFEAVAPAREDILPRMDVALFVGFAASGPIGIPVAIESAEQFKTIFGEDLPIVWDSKRGDFVYAFLAPTVRSFFQNGGLKCWVLRVARLEANETNPLNRACFNYFPLAGFARIQLENKNISSCMPAFARARAKGSWSDNWLVGTEILSQSIKLINLDEKVDGQKKFIIEIDAKENISRGDLFRLTFADSTLMAVVDDFSFVDDKALEELKIKPAFGKKFVEIISKRFICAKKLSDEVLTDEDYTVQVSLWSGYRDEENKLTTEPFRSERPAIFRLIERLQESFESLVNLSFSELAETDTPAIGTILFTKLKKESVCLLVENVDLVKTETSRQTLLSCRALSITQEFNATKNPLKTERLTFELSVKKDKERTLKLSDLAFNEGSSRFWNMLPTDENFYDFSDESSNQISSWIKAGDGLNFPLAGNGEAPENLYFPLFEAASKHYLGSVAGAGTKLQREGLEVFDEDLFLDRKLKNSGLGNLLNEAEFIRYLSLTPRTLWGIHSALVPQTSAKIALEGSPLDVSYTSYSLDECTIISVPDAVHRGWSKVENSGNENLPTPVFSSPLRPDWWRFQDCRAPKPEPVSKPLWGNFLDCSIRVLKAPENLRVDESGINEGRFALVWKSIEKGKDIEFVLQESVSPKFEFYDEIYRGKNARFNVSGRSSGDYFYRVRIEIDNQFSDWSNGLAVRIPAADDWVVNDEIDTSVLLSVQRALLRMCAARGDLFAIMNLPEGYEDTESFLHTGSLKSTKGLAASINGIEPFSFDELRALSFGAIYHPWLLTKEENFDGINSIPADGAICGVMARRSIERGAWVAPANENLQGVLGFSKEIKRDSFLDFQENSINLVRQEPRGFLVLDSDTLIDDPDLRQINVRRLLSLLRRLAIRHGAEYVFEPNDERFRRTVERGFSSLLDQMYTRGAFAGSTPAASYQVVVNESINNFRSVEQGSFIVELRVAPSLPLKFVTVRLIQSGARNSITEVF